MIKDPEKYKKESERERREYLRKLTLKKSAEIMEFLQDDELIKALKFSDHLPLSLKLGLKNAEK